MAKIEGMKPEAGQELYDVSEKVFPDIKAEPGEEAWIFMHTVPYEGSVGLVNLLTATRLGRKGFQVNLVLYGPGVLMASGTRGYPAVGQEAFPGHMAINNQLKTLLSDKETTATITGTQTPSYGQDSGGRGSYGSYGDYGRGFGPGGGRDFGRDFGRGSDRGSSSPSSSSNARVKTVQIVACGTSSS